MFKWVCLLVYLITSINILRELGEIRQRVTIKDGSTLYFIVPADMTKVSSENADINTSVATEIKVCN